MTGKYTRKICDDDPVPHALKEVLNLMNSINRRLEDCAVEWQSVVSKKQWRILNTRSLPKKSWEQSLLARTYFTDKNLDDGFQNLLMYVRNFMDNITSFIALLRGECMASKKNSLREIPKISTPSEAADCPTVVAPLDLSSCDEKSARPTTRRSSSSVQQCFADLIKAKIDLDTKFLGFEAVLNGSPRPLPRTSNNLACLCQVCSNVLEAVIDNEKILRNVVTNSKIKRRVTRAATGGKRLLPHSARIWKKHHDKKASMSLGNISGKRLLSPKDLNDY